MVRKYFKGKSQCVVLGLLTSWHSSGVSLHLLIFREHMQADFEKKALFVYVFLVYDGQRHKHYTLNLCNCC